MASNNLQGPSTRELMDISISMAFKGVQVILRFLSIMIGEFEMTDLGLMGYFLGLEVRQCNDGIFISQECK